MRTYNYRCQLPKNAESIERFDEYQLDLCYRKNHLFSYGRHVATAYLDEGELVVFRSITYEINWFDIRIHMLYVAKEWGLTLVRR